MYKALVRSHLGYCDIIYHIPPIVNPPPLGMSLSSLMESVEKIQYQAGLAITGCWKGSSRAKLYDELGWETLSDRRLMKRILQIYKITSGKTPAYLKDKLPPTRQTFLTHVFKDIRSRTDRYSNSFFPHAIDSWNSIMTHFEFVPTYSYLKNYMLALYRPMGKPVFGIHDPVGLRYLFQLRLGLSHLRSHKIRHGFTDISSDLCVCKQAAEDSYHFLLKFSLYNTQRATLIQFY